MLVDCFSSEDLGSAKTHTIESGWKVGYKVVADSHVLPNVYHRLQS